MAERSRLRLTAAYVGAGVMIDVLANIIGNAFNLNAWRWWLIGTTCVIVGILIALEIVRDGGGDPPPTSPPAGGPARSRSWQVPHQDDPVQRPRLIAELLGALDTTGGVVGLTTALAGTGGFGKTTLAAMACLRPDVQAAFPGGMLWASIGNDRSEAELSVILNDLAAQLTGSRPNFAVAEQAGRYLGGLLDGLSRNLLIIDDVWTAEELRPFLFGSASTSRLITTRNQSCLPHGARVLTVDQMDEGESRDLLTRGLAEQPTSLRSLIQLTGRWPLLMDMVNSALQRLIADGQDPEMAAQLLASQLTADGPTFLDVRTSHQRRSAVRATVTASLRLLDEEQAARYADLGIFAEDSDIPVDLLAVLWGMKPSDAQALCQELSDLSLVKAYRPGAGAVQLHDVLREHLRHELGARLPEVNRLFLDRAHAALLPDGGGWWLLARRHGYLWQNLAYHLLEAGSTDELNALLLDLRWAEQRIQHFGLASLEADLARGTDVRLVPLREALARKGHLLTSMDPPHALADVLVSRLSEVPALTDAVAGFTASLPRDVARLSNRWPIPPVDPALIRVLSSHTDTVHACAAAADGRWIAAAGADHVVRIWDTTSWAVRALLSAHTGDVTAIEPAPDGTWVVTAGRDGTTRIWETASWTEQACLASHDGQPATGAAIAPNETWIATAAANGMVEIWDTASWSSRRVFSSRHGEATGCSVSADGRWLATTGADRMVRVWDTDTWESVAVLEGHAGRTLSCVFEPTGLWLASTGADSAVRIWDTAEWTESRAMRHGDAQAVPSCAISPDGEWLVSTGADRTVRVWDTATWTNPVVQLGHTGTVTDCAILPADQTGARFVTAGADGNVRLWHGPSTARRAGTRSRNRPAQQCAAASDGSWLAVLSANQMVYLWEVGAPTEPRGLTDDPLKAVRIAVVPGTDWLITGSSEGTIQVWECPTRRQRADLAAHNGPITALAVSADGSRLLTGSAGGAIRMWDIATLTGRIHLPGHTPDSPIADCAFSNDGRLLLTCGEDGTVMVWTAERQRVTTLRVARSEPAAPATAMAAVAAEPGRKQRRRSLARIAVKSTTGGTVSRADTSPLDAVGSGAQPAPFVIACCFSPDSRSAVIACADGTVRVFDSAEWVERHRLAATAEAVTACAFSEDGTWLAVTGAGTVQVWSARTWTRAAVMPTNGPAWDLCWIPGGLDLAVGGAGGTYLFTFTPPEPG